jgi:hypothetical protein
MLARALLALSRGGAPLVAAAPVARRAGTPVAGNALAHRAVRDGKRDESSNIIILIIIIIVVVIECLCVYVYL